MAKTTGMPVVVAPFDQAVEKSACTLSRFLPIVLSSEPPEFFRSGWLSAPVVMQFSSLRGNPFGGSEPRHGPPSIFARCEQPLAPGIFFVRIPQTFCVSGGTEDTEDRASYRFSSGVAAAICWFNPSLTHQLSPGRDGRRKMGKRFGRTRAAVSRGPASPSRISTRSLVARGSFSEDPESN